MDSISTSEAAKNLFAQRDVALEKTRTHMERHQDERYVGLAQTALTETQIFELVGYRQHLRDIGKLPGFPDVELPVAPAFIS